MTEEELRAAARVSGMRGKELPSFEQVERRRFELWLMSTLLLMGVMGAMVLFTTWDPEEMSSVLRHPVSRFAMLAMISRAVVGYPPSSTTWPSGPVMRKAEASFAPT